MKERATSMSLRFQPTLLPVIITAAILFNVPTRAQDLADLTKPIYVKWYYKTKEVTNLTPAADGEKVYIPLSNGAIVSVRLEDGGLLWRSDVGGAISTSPVVDARNVYVASETLPSPKSIYPQATGVLRALSRQSGLTSWMRTLQFPVRGVISFNPDSLFFTSTDGRLYSIGKETGEIRWIKYNSAPFNSQHLAQGDKLYLSDAYGDIISIEQKTGRTLWRYRTRKSLVAPVAINGSMIYAGASDGFVYAIDGVTGRLRWRVRTGAAVQSVMAGSQWILVTSLDNFVYCLSPRNGSKIWKRQMAGRITAPPLLLKNQVLVAPLSGDECLILNLEDGKKVNSIYVGEDNNTEAAPLFSAGSLLLTTREGLAAFTNTSQQNQATNSH